MQSFPANHFSNRQTLTDT